MGNFAADLCIYILTWNVASNRPDNLPLQSALSLNNTVCKNGQSTPDFYIIGLQEVNANIKNQVSRIFYDEEWITKIQENLEKKKYVKVSSNHMQGLFIAIWSRPQYGSHMKGIETQYTKTGFGGTWGNKGAVSIRFTLYGTAMVFVAAHLAAHDDKLQSRINDYNQIVDNHHYSAPNYRNIFDHNVVFWFGDLNFRLNGKDSSEDIIKTIEKKSLTELFGRDQLKEVMASHKAFGLMKETTPDFPPTFKFKKGSSQYNTKRRPAWCDRILHRTLDPKNTKLTLTQLNYKSHSKYELSDHKPVSAEFQLSVKIDGLTDQEIREFSYSTPNIPLKDITISKNNNAAPTKKIK